ncbi:MAG: hypothetical protein Q8R74_02715 [Methylophilus sp.]|nr:hypothetical protein [Methylophilus sp.]
MTESDFLENFRQQQLKEIFMHSSDLSLAGYASIIAAALSIPLLFFSFYTEFAGLKVASVVLNILSLILYGYLTITLINLLTEKGFDAANNLLWASILMNVFAVAMTTFTDSSSSGWLSIFPILIMGILMILIGVKLQNCSDDLNGHLKTFSYTWIGSGFCLVTVFLIPIAVLVMMFMNIIQGMIFLKEADKRRIVF